MNKQPNQTTIRKAFSAMAKQSDFSDGFTLKKKRVCWVKVTTKSMSLIPICDPFEVMGRTYDETGENTGLLIRFAANRASKDIVEATVLIADLVSDARKVVSDLAGKGLWVSADRYAVGKVAELLSLIRPENDVVTVSRPGWHGPVFVSPTSEVFGESDNLYRLSEGSRFEDCGKAGSLEAWCRAAQAALECPNGDFLCVGLLSGLAGPLVNLMGSATSLLINFAGTTSRGKTTAQRLGASIWGNPYKDAALVKFNVTPGAIEAIAAKANGNLLAIDEGGQSSMTGPQYQTAVFNLAEGTGKRRLTPSAEEKKVRQWSTGITISEEVGFADKVKRDGRSPAAGAVARIWEVSVDDAEELDDETVAEIEAIQRNYGWAAPVFIQHLIDQGYPKDVERLRERVNEAELNLSADHKAPQQRRVAGAAAVLLVAGELAQEAGLIDQGYPIKDVVLRVLQRSYERMARDIDPVESALSNLREAVLRRIGLDVREIGYFQDTVHREVIGLFGYPDGPDNYISDNGDRDDAERVYLLPAEQIMALGGGNVTAKTMASALKKQGYLIPQSGKNSAWAVMPGGDKVSHYRLKGTFFHESLERDTQEAA